MGLVAGFSLYNVIPQSDSLLVTIVSAIAVVLFGTAALLAWRRRGEYELIEINDGRVLLRSSQSRTPIFDAAIAQSKAQRLILPKGGMQLFLRDGTKAIEIGNRLGYSAREQLAAQLEQAIGMEAPIGFSKRNKTTNPSS